MDCVAFGLEAKTREARLATGAPRLPSETRGLLAISVPQARPRPEQLEATMNGSANLGRLPCAPWSRPRFDYESVTVTHSIPATRALTQPFVIHRP